MSSSLKSCWIFLLLFFFVFIACLVWWLYPGDKERPYLSPYPDGKNFAFTITDDAHNQTVEKIKPIYDFLYELGFKTTIAVYVRKPTRTNGIPDEGLDFPGRAEYINNDISLKGDTLQQKDYLEYIKELHKKGFEIAIHTVSAGNDTRDSTIAGYEEYKRNFGEYPKMNIFHSNNLENVYWGAKVFRSKIVRWMFEKLIGSVYPKARFPFGGDDPNSPYFCGDIIKEKTKYVRMWGTTDINTLKFNPSMPYHDPKKPYINYWFSFSEGHTARVFNKLLQDQNIEKLTRERGATIVYTHFSSGFIKKSGNGEYIVNPVAKTQLMKLAKQKDGWFVTTSTLLDRLLLMKNVILYDTEQALIVSNVNVSLVPGLTILTKPDSTYYDWEGNPLISNEEGEIVIGVINGHSSAVLYKNDKILFAEDVVPYFDTEQALIVTNVNVTNVPDVTILVKPASTFYDWEGNPLISNEEGEIVIGDLTGRSSAVLYKNDKILFAKDAVPHWHEKTSLVLNRILVWIKTRLDF